MPLNPPLNQAHKFPVTSLISIAAIVASLRWWFTQSLSGFVPTSGSIVSEPWTLLTSIFPHVNPIHLIFNLSWWWIFGARIERAWGAAGLLGAVVLLALVSGGAEFAAGAVGVGLSGVVYGMCTLLWVVQDKQPALAGTVTRQTIQLFVIWFFVCIVLTVTDIAPIGNVAHGSGALCGWLLGKCIAADSRRRAVWLGLLAALAIAVGLGATVGRPWVSVLRSSSAAAQQGTDALMAGRYDEAIPLLEAAARKRPRDAAMLINLGIAYQHKGRDEEAVALYKRAVAIDPSQRASVAKTVAAQLDKEMNHALAKGDLAAARSLAEETLGWDPGNEHAKWAIEWIKQTLSEKKTVPGG